MRLTSRIFVSALLRRVHSTGGFAAVLRRGDEEAGAIYISCRSRSGELLLFAPALYDEAKPDDRRFTMTYRGSDHNEITDRIERESRFDADIWAIEIEPGQSPVGDLIEIAG